MIPAFLADKENRKRRGEFETENRVGASIGTYVQDADDFDDDDDVIVYHTKGGNAPPPGPSPMEEARAQMELERQREQMKADAAERQRQIDEAARVERVNKARGIQSATYDQASNYDDRQITARGYDRSLVDKYGLSDLYQSDIDMARMGIAEDDLNPGAAYNTSTTFNRALETALGGYRGELKRNLNSIAGDSYSYDTFQDTMDDDILNEILGTNKADALAQIDMAKARGQLNDVGYSRATQRLGQQGEAALADLQDLGLGVISGYRKDIDNLRSTALDKVGAADFANPYDLSSFESLLGNRVGEYNNRLRGDIFRATDGQEFFDPNTIISSSGALQGYYNPTNAGGAKKTTVANPLLDAFTTEEQKKQQTGANGVF